MASLHITGADVPHPAVGMAGRSLTDRALPGDLRIASNSPTWKVHYFARGIMHWQVGDTPLRIEPGTWLVVPPGIKHGGQRGTRECGCFYWLHLFSRRGPWPGFTTAEMPSLTEALVAGCTRSARDQSDTWARLFASLEGSDRFRAGRSGLLMGELLHACVEDQASAQQADPHASDMAAVLAWIDAHLDAPLTAHHLAHLTGLSRTRFNDRFREATGNTPAAYIHARRMERACDWLRSRRRSVTDIALNLGFSSSQAFATAFKRTRGMTPTEWRSQQTYR